MRRRKILARNFAELTAGLTHLERLRRKRRNSHERWMRLGYQALAFEGPPNEVDRSGWGDGPWQDEYDWLNWTDAATGLACQIRRNNSGAWCGYVAIPESRAARRKRVRQGFSLDELEVHGGVTFNVQIGAKRWIGFDCSHYGDLCPGLEATLRGILQKQEPYMERMFAGDQYRRVGYVLAEVERLAAQLAAPGEPTPRVPLTYCSFATGYGCLGVAILTGSFDPVGAAVRAHALGINPGGELMAIPYPDDAPEREYQRGLENRDRLLTVAEARELLGGRSLRELEQCEHTGERTIDRATGDETCSDCGSVNGKPCDHKFIDSACCLKCGWKP